MFVCIGFDYYNFSKVGNSLEVLSLTFEIERRQYTLRALEAT